jgi:hypothetical protein
MTTKYIEVCLDRKQSEEFVALIENTFGKPFTKEERENQIIEHMKPIKVLRTK